MPADANTSKSQLIVEFTSGQVVGTAGADLFFAAQGHSKLQAGAGGDTCFGGEGGGTIDLGSGNDRHFLGERIDAPPWTNFSQIPLTRIFDGAGEDVIDAPAADVIAAIDCDDDILMNLHKVAYVNATGELHAVCGTVTGGGVRTDTVVNTIEFSAGTGNDEIAKFATIDGGDGNDVLRPGGVIALGFPTPSV